MKKEILMLKKSCHSLFAALCVKKEPLGFCASLWFGGSFNQPFSLYSVCCLATVPMTFSWWDHPRSCWRKCTATDHIHLLMRCVCVCVNWYGFLFFCIKRGGGVDIAIIGVFEDGLLQGIPVLRGFGDIVILQILRNFCSFFRHLFTAFVCGRVMMEWMGPRCFPITRISLLTGQFTSCICHKKQQPVKCHSE